MTPIESGRGGGQVCNYVKGVSLTTYGRADVLYLFVSDFFLIFRYTKQHVKTESILE